MRLPLTPRRAFTIYGVVLAVLFAGYLGVLSAGQKRWVVEKDTEPLGRVDERIVDTEEPIMEFYEELDDSTSQPGRTHPDPSTPHPSVAPSPSPAEARSVAAGPPPPTGPRWVVQVGAFSQREPASQVVLRARAKGLPVRLIEPDPAGGDPYFRVWVGDDYPSPGDAKVMERLLESHGISYYTKKIP